jgi:REP element-mobilizing transposase RayT
VTKHVHKRHNKTLILYHLVCPVKYRRKALTEDVAKTLKGVCVELSQRYELHFVEIGADEDHVHFLIQSIPTLSPSMIARTIKSITAKEIFRTHPDIKKLLWGGSFWTSGFYLNTVGQYGNEEIIKQYVQNQGKTYKQLYRNQLRLFDALP